MVKAMANLKDYMFLECEDGFYFGRALKNGNISADSRKVEKGEIVQMFAEVLEDYCLKTGKPMEITRDGHPKIVAHIVIEDAGGDASVTEE